MSIAGYQTLATGPRSIIRARSPDPEHPQPTSAGSGTRPSPLPPWSLLLEESGRPGWLHMAIDQALLDLAEREGRATLRLYRWHPYCISFGRHEAACARYDRNRIESLGLAVVRRPTGGRAVWHARELTYAVAAPAALFGSLAATYRRIHQSLANGLRALGLPAVLASSPARFSPAGSGPCFAQPAGGEVLVEGRKVVGSAQCRQGGAFLQHGSVLLEDSQELLEHLSRRPVPRGLDAPLAALLQRPLGFAEAATAVVRATRHWTDHWHDTSFDAEVERAAEPHHARFRSAAWTWRR